MNDSQMNSRPKRKYAEEERRSYYTAWKQSKLNTTEFCRMHGISKSTLHSWVRSFEREKSVPGFTPLIIKDEPSSKAINKIALTIAFNNGSLQQVSLEVSEHRLVSLIQEIGHAATIIR